MSGLFVVPTPIPLSPQRVMAFLVPPPPPPLQLAILHSFLVDKERPGLLEYLELPAMPFNFIFFKKNILVYGGKMSNTSEISSIAKNSFCKRELMPALVVQKQTSILYCRRAHVLHQLRTRARRYFISFLPGFFIPSAPPSTVFWSSVSLSLWGVPGLGIRSFAHRSFAPSLIWLKSNERL